MDDEERKKIMKNLVEIVEEKNLDKMVNKMCERGVFNDGMINKYMDRKNEISERKRDL